MINNQEQDNIDLQQYWQFFKRRWLVITAVTSSVFLLTCAYTFTKRPVYEVEAKLLFNKKNNASELAGLEGVGDLTGLTNLSNPVDTEAEVIRSHPIIQQTITSLNLKDRDNQPLRIDTLLKALKIKSIRGTDVMGISYRSTNPQEAADTVNTIIKYYIENNISANRSEVRAAREFLNRELPEVERKVFRAEMALRRFKEENRVVALEEEAKAGVTTLTSLSNEIMASEANLVAANTRSQVLQNQIQLSSQEALTISSLSQSSSVQQVLEEYRKAQDDLAVARTRLTDEHPTVINLADKEAVLRRQLEGRIATTIGSSTSVSEKDLQIGTTKESLALDLVKAELDRLSLANRLTQLRKAFKVYKDRLEQLPSLEQKQLQLVRQLQIARTTYEGFLKKLQEAEVIENQNVGNARIIAGALVTDKPVSPRVPLNLALGGFMGLLLGTAAGLILESKDKTLKTVEEAKELLGYPILAVIPSGSSKVKEGDEDKSQKLPVVNSPYSSQTVAFEMLQANLGFTLSDKDLKVIAVTSTMPGEGKSFVSSNLAAAAVQMGRRVLLIDADMRRPRQHEIWDIQNLQGLSNILVGQIGLENSTQEVQVNLDVLSGGKEPPNPAALLDSMRLSTLIEEASGIYDFIIIDTPPVGLFADAMIVGKLVDGVLMVVRPGEVTSPAAVTAKLALEQSGQKVLGMAINAVNSGDSSGHYYSYSYSSQYYRRYYRSSEDSENGKVKA
ncbi:polysaccharide biosynthesis tyrosine autokinase [Cronbergia sp. UHCC 0137]|uniref:GumC family protein n=1 Tax=Cronbergia sp. UHCC 0137 TaxID=3110239 RepID=UPI002B1F7788|nr:polysaccharide biosynthesis tyrosine autokinase [Cronbergia sp. UHCC 0137]MEA5618344.1 polysaccharide biosynthesis tyrosine autokinase [Cronbergia sp. UHCC 0137]